MPCGARCNLVDISTIWAPRNKKRRNSIVRALIGKNIRSMLDADIVNAVQKSKLDNVTSDFNKNFTKQIKHRIDDENKRLLKLT